MLDVRRLRLLRELSHRGTIAAVAQALTFTPSAVSQQLTLLEREAGVPLLERSGRGVTLTPAGLSLVRQAEAVLALLEQASAELAQARQGLAGPLRIGTFPTAARAIIPAALTTLASDQPGLEPMVCELDPAYLPNALRSADLDVALIHDYDFVPSPAEPGLTTTSLCREPMYLATSSPPAAAQAAGDSLIGRYRDAAWITASPGTRCEAMTIRACQAAGFTPRVRHQVDEFATVLALVAAGQGVAIVPYLGIVSPPAEVILTRLPIYRRTMIAFRSGADAHPAVVAITAALRSAIPPDLRAPVSRGRAPRRAPGAPEPAPGAPGRRGRR